MSSNFKKKYITLILTIVALIISTFIWDYIKIPFNTQNSLYGEYSKNYYNSNNETLRFIIFISLPILTFFISFIFFNKKSFKIIKYLFLFKKGNFAIESQKKDYLFKFFFYTLIIVLIIEFLCIDLNNYLWKIDYFHEGIFLTSSKNFIFKNNFWISSYVEHGFLAQFAPGFIWKITSIESIGIVRFYQLLMTF